MIKQVVLISVLGLLSASCTWVKLEGGGDNVAVLSASEVSQCTKIRETTHSVFDRLRSESKVQKELETLARNEAATYGGDTIVATSDVYEGRRNYDIYRCRL